jgi:hypothetical protein
VKFIDDSTRDDLAKSSTILQCILASLDFECNKFHIQPEVIGVDSNEAMVSVDPMSFEQMIQVCNTVSGQFKRHDNAFTCKITNEVDGFVSCFATGLEDYKQLI